MVQCHLTFGYQISEGNCCLQLDYKNGGDIFLKNIDTPIYQSIALQ